MFWMKDELRPSLFWLFLFLFRAERDGFGGGCSDRLGVWRNDPPPLLAPPSTSSGRKKEESLRNGVGGKIRHVEFKEG